MKRVIIMTAALIAAVTLYSQPQLYLGVRGGAGAVLNNTRLNGVTTSEGSQNGFFKSKDWFGTFKAEALFGIKHFRIGYRFGYMRLNGPKVSAAFTPTIDDDRYTAYFNARYTNIFAHYGAIEIPLINAKHFALTPGIALGGYTGNTVDRTTGEKVRLGSISKYRFTMGAELNAEIKFSRVAIVFGPNYYLFNMQDKVNAKWRQYNHVIGGDVGLRVNLL